MEVNSFSFGGTDLRDYGLYIAPGARRPLLPDARGRFVALADTSKTLDFGSFYDAREFRLPCVIIGSSMADLNSKLDSIRSTLDVLDGLQQLIFGLQETRYWLAKYNRGSDITLIKFVARLTLNFISPDPFAFSTTSDTPNHPIAADPTTVSETTGGTAPIRPVWKLTPDAPVSGAVQLENDTRSELIQWSGDLDGAGDYIEIDVENHLISKNGTASMAGASGTFPLMSPGVANSITVTGMTGDLDITYRDRYL